MSLQAVETLSGDKARWDWKASYIEKLRNGDGLELFSEASVTPDTTLILAGPPRLHSQGFTERLSPIGLVTDLSFNSDNQLKPMWEIGTDKTYFTRGKTSYQLNIGAMIADKPSLMKLFTRQSPQQGPEGGPAPYPDRNILSGQFWANIDTEQTAAPFGILMIFKTKGVPDDDTKENGVVGAMYLENCNIANFSFNLNSQSVVLQENISIMFDRMVAVDYSTGD